MALVTVRFYALLRLRLPADSLPVEATDVKEVIEQDEGVQHFLNAYFVV